MGNLLIHLLLHCPRVYDLWAFIFCLVGFDWVVPHSADTILKSWEGVWLVQRYVRVWRAVPARLMWCICNQHTFEEKEISLPNLSTNKMEVAKVEKQNMHSYPVTASRLYPWLIILDEKAPLPSLESIDYRGCILSSSPGDPECHILFFNRLENSLLVCQKGDLEFNKQFVIFAEDFNLKNFAMVGKTIYCLGSKHALYTAEFVGRTVQFTRLIMEELPWPSPLDLPRFDSFLVESGGELFLVQMMFFGFRMEEVYGFFVFRMDFEEKRLVTSPSGR
ncbi:hypothetical protein SO802_009445 [Lithocarpus litseifolius]|uniref:KIB1-4 beta-propeller domain-containing protein n=1 Tax=Lithocarpus litseifolius TaxID=425828 RepID=A0AAW2DEA6_9ROSI